MPQPKRPPGRYRKATLNEKATLPSWFRWLLSEAKLAVLATLRTALVWLFTTIAMMAIPHSFIDSFGAPPPNAITTQYFHI